MDNASEIFEVEGNGSENDCTLFSLSDEYFEAARVLQETPPVRVNYALVTYYLLGHSAELALKAYLYKHGLNIKDLREIGHNLEKLVTLAKGNGLSEKVKFEHILHLANTYKDKNLEYRKIKKASFPPAHLLTEEIKALQYAVFDKIST
ncbi:MAG: hypothetical protein Q8K02_18055 [Flavobacterium sp.]|nr:hypothetical protein [Flavobacterium sp.]